MMDNGWTQFKITTSNKEYKIVKINQSGLSVKFKKKSFQSSITKRMNEM